jgi:hypothetical protein
MDLLNKIVTRRKNTLLFVLAIFLVNMLAIQLYYESIKRAMDNNYVYLYKYPIKLQRTVAK